LLKKFQQTLIAIKYYKMPEESNEQEKWVDKLQHTYRLVIMRDESFEEVGSYRLTRLNIYLLVSTLIVATAFFVILFIVFTPLKQMIPGYGDVNLRDNAEQLAQRVQELEEQNKAHTTYISSVQRLFSANYETEDAIPTIDSSETTPDSLLKLDRIEEDEELRNAVERDQPLVPEIDGADHENAKYNRNRVTPLEQLLLMAPVKGEISNGFMQDKGHYGVDVLAPKNTPIKSIMDGIIIQSDWTLETGKTITIQHPNNVVTLYKHNSALLKKVGDTVKAGEAVAIIGNTGTLSSGPHLHFELWYNGKPTDPIEFISFK
jgi:murein DD-endopeptidase MepM/ murein hydrolase activator NlpD